MKVINNKRGSALLWCVLLTVILTILLGSVTTAAYMYHSYTVNTVKKQQAYFTARSCINAIMEVFASEEASHTSGSAVYEYEDFNIELMPAEDETITITSFEGLDKSLGTASATITRNKSDENLDQVNIEVTAYYPDAENGTQYVMKASIARQPLYFGGIALKSLVLGNNTNFSLGENTDLYWYTYKTEEEAEGKTDITVFDTTKEVKDSDGNTVLKIGSGSSFDISGNLITQGDCVIKSGMTVSGHKFNATTSFTSANHPKKIWNANQFILTNQTLEVDENTGVYSSSIYNSITHLTNMTAVYCNNSVDKMDELFGSRDLLGTDKAMATVMGWADDIIGTFIGNDDYSGLTDTFSDNTIENLKISDSSSNSTSTRYIEVLSMVNSVDYLITEGGKNIVDNIVKYIASYAISPITNALEAVGLTGAANLVQNASDAIASSISKMMGTTTETISNFWLRDDWSFSIFGYDITIPTLRHILVDYGLTVLDISYIDFDSNAEYNRADQGVVPVTYMLVEGTGQTTVDMDKSGGGLYVRVKYGSKPDASSRIYKAWDNLQSSVADLASRWFDVVSESSYVVVYVGKNSTLELGTTSPKIAFNDPAFSNANQTYFYSIYGQPGSTVKLIGTNVDKDGKPVTLTIVGEVKADNLEVEGNVSVIYSSTNGSQVAKQKVGEFWTVTSYSD